MQIPLHTTSSVEAYIANQEWRTAGLSRCPLHPDGGCTLCRHGSYARLTTPGVRVARWYCPEGHKTFSLLPDFLAVRFPGLLAAIEADVILARAARSIEAAADTLRGLDISLPSAVRWLRRRIHAVRSSFGAAVAMAPREMSRAILEASSQDRVPILLSLRANLASRILEKVAAPLGFGGSQRRSGPSPARQHDVGPDPDCDPRYAGANSGIQAHALHFERFCSARSPHRRRHTPGLACRSMRERSFGGRLYAADQAVSSMV